MKHQCIVVLDFGGQMDQLVARKVRSLGVYCEVLPHTTTAAEIKEKEPIGIFLVGGVGGTENAPPLMSDLLSLGAPILGIGTAGNLLLQKEGASFGTLEQWSAAKSVNLDSSSLIFANFSGEKSVWFPGYQGATTLPEGWRAVGASSFGNVAFENKEKHCYVTAFRPEVSGSPDGVQVLENFLAICGAKKDWSMKDYAEASIASLKAQIGNGKVLLALSGGVDSSVVAALLEKAIGEQLYCIFVDHGCMRYNEPDEVEAAFKESGMHFIRVDAEKRFLDRLLGVTDPEKKRKIIGEEFIRVFEEEAKKIGTVDFFAQGTIYPDIIESESPDGTLVKSHHNVGGLPDHVDFKEIVEPLRLLFKDEVRALGAELGLPDYLVNRQPFPGPGLAVRVIGDLTKEKLDILRHADFIYREEIANARLDKEISQYFAVLTNMRSVGVTNDQRTYDYTMALRAVSTTDFMTADWVPLPFELLDRVSRRIASEVGSINRIVYDITSKPPATIEWE